MDYDDIKQEELGLNDLLALDRTILANERTVLSYVRTAVMIFVSSITLLKVFPENEFARIAGFILIPAGLFTSVVGFQRYFRLSRSLSRRRRK